MNEDWVDVEPVNAAHRTVARDRPSPTVLLANLANRIRPILRYGLGDSVVVRPDLCPCGSQLLALPVARAGDRRPEVGPPASGAVVLSRLVVKALPDRVADLEHVQAVRVNDAALRVRMSRRLGADGGPMVQGGGP